MLHAFASPAFQLKRVQGATLNTYHAGVRVSPEWKEGLLCIACHSCSNGQHEGDDAKGGVDWYKTSSELGWALLTAQQDPKAEESYHKLKTKH